jgi:phosphomannomutase
MRIEMTGRSDASLRENLEYEPRILKFGTSGRRGDVTDLTQLEVYINTTAELEYLLSLPRSEGGIAPGEDFYFALDLRPSSSRFVPEQRGRGEIAQTVERAIADAGMRPVNLGHIPTPALANFAFQRERGSIMITGSHIPFERNGYKTNTARGELLKKHEAPIGEFVERVRARIYRQPYDASPFDRQGRFKSGHRELSPESGEGRERYIRRYADFYEGLSLRGLRVLAYQHSAVGRDLLVEILERLGAAVIPAGRSDTFVPIDTENINAEQLARIQALSEECWRKSGPFDAVVSTDGDSDRPLILGVDPADPCKARFFGGDRVGMIVAEHLGADAVVVPISCNDAIDRGSLRGIVEPKTRIGSPYVIAGMDRARRKGRKAVCGWEANGGFLTGSEFAREGHRLPPLPTRDAVLPILGVLFESIGKRVTVSRLFDRLPKRFSRAALLANFPRPASERILARFSPSEPRAAEILFEAGRVKAFDADGGEQEMTESLRRRMESIRAGAREYFSGELGFDGVVRVNYTDGVRLYFGNGDVAHIRPSGNADELRIYAVADSQERADAIARLGVGEPDGILRRLESSNV